MSRIASWRDLVIPIISSGACCQHMAMRMSLERLAASRQEVIVAGAAPPLVGSEHHGAA